MTILIVIILAFISAAALYEGWRRAQRASVRRNEDATSRLRTADEDLPSETGRFRVQEMLKKTAGRATSGEKSALAAAGSPPSVHDAQGQPELSEDSPEPGGTPNESGPQPDAEDAETLPDPFSK